jgi:hypothetical protein
MRSKQTDPRTANTSRFMKYYIYIRKKNWADIKYVQLTVPIFAFLKEPYFSFCYGRLWITKLGIGYSFHLFIYFRPAKKTSFF